MFNLVRDETAVIAPELGDVMKQCRKALWTVFAFSFAINILVLATPIYMLQVLDRVLRSGHVETLIMLTIMAGGAILIMSVLDMLRGAIAMRMGAWIYEALAPIFLTSSVRANLKGDDSGQETLRDLSSIQNFVAQQGMSAFLDSPWVPIFVGLIWIMHPNLGAVAFLSAAVLFLLSLANERVTRSATHKAHEAHTDAMNIADMTIRNAESVRALGMMPAMLARWRQANATLTDTFQISGDLSGRIHAATKFVRYVVQIAILGMGAYLVVNGDITSGTMIAAAILLGRALAPVETAIGGWKSFVEARQAFQRLNTHLLTYPTEEHQIAMPLTKGHLSVQNLSYALDDGEGPVLLHEINFEVEPGEVLAIIGPSGAGKSTLCRLLVGLDDPVEGAVRLDGTDLMHWPPDDLGLHLGYLPQDIDLFTGTVRDNIARMGPASDEEVVNAALLSRAHNLIQDLPGGYATHIGSGGIRLSGGQRQRIGLARAVLGDPRLIVLDEPNANLDQSGEAALTEAIKDLKEEDCALVIVGHRSSTLAQADKILVLENGTMTMYGDRDEVLEAWSEASAQEAGEDTVPLRRPSGPPALNSPDDHTIEADAS